MCLALIFYLSIYGMGVEVKLKYILTHEAYYYARIIIIALFTEEIIYSRLALQHAGTLLDQNVLF